MFPFSNYPYISCNNLDMPCPSDGSTSNSSNNISDDDGGANLLLLSWEIAVNHTLWPKTSIAAVAAVHVVWGPCSSL